MYITYGSYTHGVGLAGYTHEREPSWNDAWQRESRKHRVTINGVVQVPNDTPEANQYTVLTALIAELENAYAVDGRDFTITLPDNTVAMRLRSADMIGGLRVTKEPSYPVGTGIEWVRMRTFTVVIEAEEFIPIENGGSADVSFTETVTFEGTGGPDVVILTPMEGDPVEIQVSQRTMCRAVQSGRAARRRGAAIAPPPLWPDKEIGKMRQISPVTPQTVSGGQRLSEISWSYTFQSPFPFSQQLTNRNF
jgi:hypothetical protein